MTQKYSVGSIVDTPKGKIKILSYTAGKRLPEGKKRHPRATIEFLATGTVINIQTTNISTGKFSDYNEKTVYGVGYLGSTVSIPSRKMNSVVRKSYDLWANMLKRAYGNYKGSYVGVTVDEYWHSFTNFLQSLPNVPNYHQWLDSEESMVLDKDTRVRGNTTYSVDTCTFITNRENVAEASNRRWSKEKAALSLGKSWQFEK